MFTRIKLALLKLGRVKQKVFCLFARHKWRYYHRRRRLPVLVSRETHYGIFPRRVCVHCGKRETVDVTPLAAAIAYESAIAELDRQRWSESEANEPRTLAHPRGLGIDRDPYVSLLPDVELKALREEYEKHFAAGVTNMDFETWRLTRYVPPEAVSNESGAPPYVPGGLPDYDGVARKTQES